MKKREEYQRRIEQVAPERLVFLDESGFSLALYLAYGWSVSGQRLYESLPVCRGKNLSVLGAIGLSGMLATVQKEGAIKRVDLESFLETALLPCLSPGQVIVLDNARAHHGGRIAQIVESVGCSVLYLPPYSPDFNPIELAWGWIKHFVRRLAPRDVDARLAAIQAAIAAVPAEFAKSWFRKAGLQT